MIFPAARHVWIAALGNCFLIRSKFRPVACTGRALIIGKSKTHDFPGPKLKDKKGRSYFLYITAFMQMTYVHHGRCFVCNSSLQMFSVMIRNADSQAAQQNIPGTTCDRLCL